MLIFPDRLPFNHPTTSTPDIIIQVRCSSSQLVRISFSLVRVLPLLNFKLFCIANSLSRRLESKYVYISLFRSASGSKRQIVQ